MAIIIFILFIVGLIIGIKGIIKPNSQNLKPTQNNAEVPKITNRIQNNTDNIEEIKKYKNLLDMGVITQEEFIKKKNELLNL